MSIDEIEQVDGASDGLFEQQVVATPSDDTCSGARR